MDNPSKCNVSCVFRHRMTSDGTLAIRNMEKKDGGVYGCLASNQAGTDTMTSILTYIGECTSIHPSISCAHFCYSYRLWGGELSNSMFHNSNCSLYHLHMLSVVQQFFSPRIPCGDCGFEGYSHWHWRNHSDGLLCIWNPTA